MEIFGSSAPLLACVCVCVCLYICVCLHLCVPVFMFACDMHVFGLYDCQCLCVYVCGAAHGAGGRSLVNVGARPG